MPRSGCGDTGTLRGIVGGSVDLAYTAAVAHATAIDHGSVYSSLVSGTIDDADGLVDNLGGGTFNNGEGTTQWVRMATTTLTSAAIGDATFTLGHDLSPGPPTRSLRRRCGKPRLEPGPLQRRAGNGSSGQHAGADGDRTNGRVLYGERPRNADHRNDHRFRHVQAESRCATVQITGNYQKGQDLLSFADTKRIKGKFDARTGKLTLPVRIPWPTTRRRCEP